MTQTWQSIKLSKVLTKSNEWIDIDLSQSYKQVTVKMWGKGVELRSEVLGTEISASKRLQVHPEQFILSRIDARHGAFGLIPNSLNLAVVTNDFPVFNLNRELLLPDFLNWLSKTADFVDICRLASEGTTNRVRLKEDKFLSTEIRLPPIAEQRRIVARIEELAAKIEEARGLRVSAIGETDALYQQTCWDILDSQKWKVEVLDKVLLESPRNGLSPQTKVTEDGRCMLRINAVSSSPTRYVDLTAYNLVNVLDDVAHPFTIRNDDVFIVRYNGDINRLAKAAIFKSEQETDIIYPDKLMRLRADQTKILPDFLVYALGSKQVRSQIAELGKTTAGQIGISGKNVKSFRIPVPPLVEQPRIVFYLDDLKARIDNVRSVRENALKEFDALLPTILDKAFKGEL
jgi:type I restriction enzyme S subunit